MKQTLYFLVILVTFPLFGDCQSSLDSSALYKRLIYVSNNYRRAPLYLNVRYRSLSNLLSEANDSVSVNSVFYYNGLQSYAQFSDMEEVSNDSLMILVDGSTQRIKIFHQSEQVSQWAIHTMGLPLQDSSVNGLAISYSISEVKGAASLRKMIMNSRGVVPGTMLAPVTIIFEYNADVNEPTKVLMTQRSLIHIPVEQVSSISQQYQNTGSIIKIAAESYFVKEQQYSFEYLTIAHDLSRPFPAIVSDRINIDPVTGYVPAAAYQGYVIQVIQ